MSLLYYRILCYSLPRKRSGFLTPSSGAVSLVGTLCPTTFHSASTKEEEEEEGEKKSVCKKGLIQSKQPFRGADVGVFCLREPNEGVLGSKRRGFSLHLRSGEVWHKVTDSRRSVCPCSPLEGFSESSPPTQETFVICLLPETRWISPV